MSDKRIYQRAPVELAASYGVPEAEDITNATVVNISKGGFCFQSAEPMETQTDIMLQLEIGNNQTIKIPVRTVWVKKIEGTEEYQVGVQITDASNPDFDKFLDYYAQEVKKLQKEL